MTRFWKWLIGDWWRVEKCGFPHSGGYCLRNRYRRTSMDHGCSQHHLQLIADRMNGSKEW